MSIVSRTNLAKNPSFELDLSQWSAFGGASISRVADFFAWDMRVTFPTAAAGAAGASMTVTGLTVGATYFVFMHVPNKSGTTTVQYEAQGITTGASFATNDILFKQGSFTFTAAATTATIRIKSASASTAGDYVDVATVLVEATNPLIVNYAPFDGSTPGAYWSGPVGQAPSIFQYYDTEVGSKPYFVVEFDARPVMSTDFVLDRNALDDSSVALIESPRWLHVPDAETISIRRGRQSDDTDMSAGTATIVLRDYDGTFDPDNPATPLQINGVPVMRAGMRIRVSVLVDVLGSLLWEPLFVGSLENVDIDRTYEPTVTVSAVDDMAKLASAEIPSYDPPLSPGAQSFWRVLWALSFAGLGFWDNTYGANLQRQMLATSGGGSVLAELQKAANCEGGRVYAARDGRIHVGTHADDFATTPAAVFSDSATGTDLEYDEITTSTSLRTIINRCIVDRGDQAASVTAQDDDSIALNQRVWSETVDAPLYNDFDATALAEWRATRRSRSATRVDSLRANLRGQDLLAVLNAMRLDISNVIRIKRYAFGRGIDDVYGIEGIDHEISVAGGWGMTLYTSALDITGLYADQPQPFILDTSALDSSDILASF